MITACEEWNVICELSLTVMEKGNFMKTSEKNFTCVVCEYQIFYFEFSCGGVQ